MLEHCSITSCKDSDAIIFSKDAIYEIMMVSRFEYFIFANISCIFVLFVVNVGVSVEGFGQL